MVGSRVVFNKKTGRYELIHQYNGRGTIESPCPTGGEVIMADSGYGSSSQYHEGDAPDIPFNMEGPTHDRTVQHTVSATRRNLEVTQTDGDEELDIYQFRRQKFVNAFKPKKRGVKA